jgi:NhaP-type Na+/H+ and K+/H+ antiporter
MLHRMPRIPIAVAAFLVGFSLYVAAVIVLADRLSGLNWLVQAVYFLIAGLLWTVPTRRLMVWAARR